MRQLLIATRNKGKVEEIAAFLKDMPYAPRSVNDLSALEGFEPEESGSTFEENALIKAREYGKRAGMLTLSDDSGLEIKALGGEPGVRSARYVPGSDEDRYKAVLQKMQGIAEGKRGARFVSVIAVYDPTSDSQATARGESLGSIAKEASGDRGFGYDPIFISDELGKTYAEATLEEKMSVDHRGRALAQMKDIMQKMFV